jgi:uncharacterized protein (TIGR02246 family)
MTRAVVLALVAVLVSATLTSGQGSDGVKLLDEQWAAAAKKGDVEALAALYAPDAVYYPPDMMAAKGRDAIRKAYADWLGATTVTDAKFDSTYSTSGDLSYAFGTATVTMQPKEGGAAQTVTVRVTEIAKKIGGKWHYVVDHASAPLPAQ